MEHSDIDEPSDRAGEGDGERQIVTGEALVVGNGAGGLNDSLRSR